MIYNKINNKKPAFSLVEVLISLLLISVIMVALSPVITRKISEKANDGVVFTYNEGNNTTEDDVCFLTNLTDYGSFTESYTSTSNCSEYTFTVPVGVHKINLTLVAGGGGGGGAGGRNIGSSYTLASEYTLSQGPYFPYIKLLRLNAKGEDGGEIDTDCDNSYDKCGGKGGASSPAIVDVDVTPFLRKKEFWGSPEITLINTPSSSYQLNCSASSGDDGSFSCESTDSSGSSNYTLSYKISSSYTISCQMGSNSVTGTEDSDFSACGINETNIIKSADGNYGYTVNNSETISTGVIFPGGTGGGVSTYGGGGRGAGVKLTCPSSEVTVEGVEAMSTASETCGIAVYNSGVLIAADEPTAFDSVDVDTPLTTGSYCTASNATSTTAVSAMDGSSGYAKFLYNDSPVTDEQNAYNSSGGGGSGGTAVRIRGMSVTPGETYIIRVGKGGLGGSAGVSASSAVSGGDGEGGVSTAVYDSKGNLIYMVNGGAGGQGGSINSSKITGYPGRFNPKLFAGSSDLMDNIHLDDNFAETTTANNQTAPSGAGISEITGLSYPFYDFEPYKTLNTRQTASANYSDNRTGGFSGFDTDGSIDTENVSYKGSTVNSVYDGLYYFDFINNAKAYRGGLGGFSGLGGKAGCGAFFTGNKDGIANGASDNTDVKNKMTIDSSLYDVSDYYSNCSLTNSNGQTAEFIKPVPNSSNFGSAGAGGGGGGYHTDFGPGKGGDGQNGYVMIEWRK